MPLEALTARLPGHVRKWDRRPRSIGKGAVAKVNTGALSPTFCEEKRMCAHQACSHGSRLRSRERRQLEEGQPVRFFLCVRCRAQVFVCRSCDRGQIYCNDGCAKEARRAKQREAGRRDQGSSRGREAHALRSRRYRVRIKAGVTHQGPPRTDNAARLGSAAAVSEPSKPASPRRGAMRPFHLCDWCRSGCSPFVRQQFLRRRRPYRIATGRPVHCRPP